MTVPATVTALHRARASVAPLPFASPAPPAGVAPASPAPARATVLTLDGGERVQLESAERGQRLTLTCREGRALLEYDTHTGCLRVTGPISGVSVESSAPDVALAAAGNLSLRAEGQVSIRGALGVSLEAGAASASPSAVARLAPSGLTYAGAQLSLAAEAARLAFQRATVQGSDLRASWSRVGLASRKIEIEAHELRSKVASVAHEIERSLTVKAGRIREWVRGSHHTRAERCEVRASGEVRIDGQRINLG